MKTILLFILFPFILFCQSFETIVKDAEDLTPLAFVNVSILNKIAGTNTNAEGEFSLPLQKFKTDTIFVSHLGFMSKKIIVNDYLLHPEKYKEIFLQKEDQGLTEVVLQVKRRKYSSSKSLGVNKSWFPNRMGVQFGMQQALFIPNKKMKLGKIAEVSFWVGEEDQIYYNSRLTWFRVKFYDYDEIKNEPENLLSYQEIIVKPKGNKKQELKVDVTNFHIPFPENGICVVLETVNPKPAKGNDGQFTTYPHLIYSREKENRSWKNYRGQNWFQQAKEHKVTATFMGNKKHFYINPAIQIKVRYVK
jgi:hypothetical protein